MTKQLHKMNSKERLYHEVMPLTLQDMYKSFHVYATKPGMEFAYSTSIRGVLFRYNSFKKLGKE